MPVNASAKKRVRRNEKRAAMNGAAKSAIRTSVKKVELALAAGDAGAAEAALKAVQPKLAKGASKGLLKKNAASRKMSRLTSRVKALKKA